MGKQTAIAMTEEDEKVFLFFLRESADIQIFLSFAPTKEALIVRHFVPDEWTFFIWNKAFEWIPEYAQVTGDKAGERQGWYYIQNKGTAPVIEYSRQNVDSERGAYGRIYWAKHFSSSGDLPYDVNEFNKWYGRVARWVRKHGKQRSAGAYETYYHPDAWNKYEKAP